MSTTSGTTTIIELFQSLGIPFPQSQGQEESISEVSEPFLGAHDGDWLADGELIVSENPSTGQVIAKVQALDLASYPQIIQKAQSAFETWRTFTAPARGEWVRVLGEKLREHKSALGYLVSLECGKILSEGEGEVQEMIDMADFAVGLCRQLYGLTMHSERPGHRMYEQWHPLGPVGVITAFNFPVAVWAWNAMVAAVCGNTVVWKPSEKTPLCSIAIQALADQTSKELNYPTVSYLINGFRDLGEAMAKDPNLPLISATGSCAMGRSVAPIVAERMGRSLLELGGNNAAIILDDAELDLALRAVAFSAVGTAGQRCTTLRRAFVQEGIYDKFKAQLLKVYEELAKRHGSATHTDTLVGPLIDKQAINNFEAAVAEAQAQGATVLFGGSTYKKSELAPELQNGNFVTPTLIEATPDLKIVHQETFAPILYLIKTKDLPQAIADNNAVDQGLSSAIFTTSIKSAEKFLSAAGSDCGIANVNIGTSGAEIGGAFGGEKHTGGGREAGSDSWKAYMRRQTCTINHSDELPLAQGVKFDI